MKDNNENKKTKNEANNGEKKGTRARVNLKAVRDKLRLEAPYEDPIRPEEVDIDELKVPDVSKKADRLVYLRVLTNLAIVLVSILFIIFVLPKIITFFVPFVIAAVIAIIANPIVRFFKFKLKISRKITSVVIIILVLAAIVGVIYGLGALAFHEIHRLVQDKDAIISYIENGYVDLLSRLSGVIAALPEGIRKALPTDSTEIGEWFGKLFESFKLPTLATAGNYASNVVNVILGIIITILASYFLIVDRDDIACKLKKIMPQSTVDYYHLIISNFKKAIVGYFSAQFKIMVIVFVLMTIGFAILKIPYFWLIALGTAFLDFLPVFGMGAVLWPWIVIDIIVGNYFQAIGLGIVYILGQLARQLLQPKLVGDAVEMNPLATLFFMFVGYRIGNIFGLIIGIPVGMIIISLYNIGAFDRTIKGIKILAKGINGFRKY